MECKQYVQWIKKQLPMDFSKRLEEVEIALDGLREELKILLLRQKILRAKIDHRKEII